MDLSIVIPVFEESTKIAQDIEAAADFLNNNSLSGEIIVVDDGSFDNTAESAELGGQGTKIPVQVIRYSEHRGKGCAVRTGIRHSKGETVLFIDSGLCIPYENILRGLELIKTGQSEIAHGSRNLSASTIVKPHTFFRQISSWLFRKFLVFGMKIPAELTDTQCGLKLYKGDIGRTLYENCETDGFMFDLEIILQAQKHGFRIREFPIEWTADLDSRLSLIQMPGHLLKELFRIRRSLWKR